MSTIPITGVFDTCRCLHMSHLITKTFCRNVQLFTTYPHPSFQAYPFLTTVPMHALIGIVVGVFMRSSQHSFASGRGIRRATVVLLLSKSLPHHLSLHPVSRGVCCSAWRNEKFRQL